MSTLPFAMMGLDSTRVAQLAVNVLAVAGGFLVGYIATLIGAKVLDKYLTAGKTPLPLHKVARLLGGAIVALLVALVVFGEGGGGLGSGTGEGKEKVEGTGVGEGTGQTVSVPAPKVDTPTPTPPPKTTQLKEADKVYDVIRVTVLGGEDVKELKFYRVDDDAVPKTLKELQDAVKTRQQAATKPVAIAYQFAPNGLAGKDTPGTLRLLAFAQHEGLAVVPPGEK
ncbi:hypothetical protein [Fimbriiglobus ruber]|uniref:Uncharacterized protein n=1 Tax=Fimbriiglobus ruber TaxID=1908690 RepID=A0A225DXS0_9BACT|nr:hypothetical protein [Fimbriiglobus ruber]OWK40907.1 hypothetical protein FRUB_04799 [Fimbriiglobus ruber]